MNKVIALLLIASPAFADTQIREFGVKTHKCLERLEKTSAMSFECIVNVHPISNEILIKKDERNISLPGCKITIESTTQGYWMTVTRDFIQKRPFLTHNEAKACLAKAAAVSRLDDLVLTSIVARMANP